MYEHQAVCTESDDMTTTNKEPKQEKRKVDDEQKRNICHKKGSS